jgi:hypothetical protein
VQNYKLKFKQEHYEQKRRTWAKKLWKSSEDHQKLKLKVLKKVIRSMQRQTLKSIRSWRSLYATTSEAEATGMYIVQNLADKILWLKNNHTKDSVTFSKGIFVDYKVNLIHKGSVRKNCTFVLLLLKMVE